MSADDTAGPTAFRPRGRFAETVGSWRAALRIARREARRARRRTALVLAMIALPVLALTFAAVSYDMSELTHAERVGQRIGNADAELRWTVDNPIVQDIWGDEAFDAGGERRERTRPARAEEVLALLPPGSRVASVEWTQFEARVGDQLESYSARILDLTDPLARSTVRLRAGRVPAAATEIAVTAPALRGLGVPLGDQVVLADGSRWYTVVGVVEFPDELREVIAVHPGGVPAGELGPSLWLADLPGPVDAALVRRLNARGVTVTTRGPAPGTTEIGADDGLPLSVHDAEEAGSAVLVVGLGLLEVVLLVGPAFAVGVRRRRRDLALVAVAGGDAVHLRRIVLADGVVLGFAGAAAGLLLGVAAAFAAQPLLEENVYGHRSGGYRVFPTALAAIAAVAVLAGVLAALVPAWTAARQDVVAGLAGRRTVPPHRRRWPLLGLALTAVGTGTAALGAQHSSALVVLTGIVLGELGLVFTTPTLVAWLARAGPALPLAPRIALRDASRNRSSTAPAVSAIMAAVAGCVAIGVWVASDEARARAQWRPGIPPGHVMLLPTREDELPPLPAVTERIRHVLAADSVARIDRPVCAPPVRDDEWCSVVAVLPPHQLCPFEPEMVRSVEARRQALADARCRPPAHDPSGYHLPVVVTDGSALPALTDAPPEEVARASAVLRAGGAVVTDPRYLHEGRVTVTMTRNNGGSEPPAVTTAAVPGYVLRGGLPVDHLALSAPLAGRLGLAVVPEGYAVATGTAPTDAQQRRLVAELRPLAHLMAMVEAEAPEPRRQPLLVLLAVAAGMITVGAAGVATGLAAAEGRRDLSTLAAVGASPGVRRVLSVCQAGVIAGLGSVLGIGAGLGSAAVILTSVNRQLTDAWPVQTPYPIMVPWVTLGVLVVVPLLAMAGAGLFTRSRLAVERRLD
ncbi:FtsX-like permease family protein [Micromonospora sp. KC721]|uniref:FtsX-like permease family protein n=1 Tax=Micromonospora sp. KC721 TaxID=2530380 RepID=UPI0010509630|nr:FtsX-like permease family protein [Micromonospora sp. KC721]TDB80079.1 ABC transporter permease [Micromonospora sp. KC721]